MRIVGIVVLALGVAAVETTAQEPIRSRLQHLVVVPNGKADELRRQAESLYARPRSYRRAAGLHEREAQVRNRSDAQRVSALAQAARLYSYLGDVRRARELMERAARSALQRGDVMRGAHALLDAAFLAMRERDVNAGLELARQAELLTQSPLLTDADKLAILRRIDPARVARSN